MLRSEKPVQFWQEIIGDDDLIKSCRHKLDDLLSGRCAGQLERKLVDGYYVYSYRLNDANRLLFTTVQVDGVNYLLVLENVPNHDYQKAKFHQPGVLRNHLANHQD